MKVFKNYRPAKKGHIEEFMAINIRYNDTEVFADLPVCVVPYEKELREPMIFQQQAGIGIAIERTELLKIIATQKVFHLKKGPKGQVKEVPFKEATHHFRLPKDTDVSELDIVNNQVFKIEKQEEVKPKEQKK